LMRNVNTQKSKPSFRPRLACADLNSRILRLHPLTSEFRIFFVHFQECIVDFRWKGGH
jgi:hypothetical protein